ncbi:2-amino-4-hydroxy-6-hydroxymethyldihydropteridine pyrophosphokinase [Devosia limi DSM 17137]|uniref:2-amino-4-hydroxy-6-hydroxymethyldihydropteridine pyrophosphokinase n=1 Tax=Devosia limi DSM 17137 TaxID=1121477 RepID=A0A0F5L579_9HYPH|nr:2-amino-4-hydroxy-6-hydroxymethyldihydropteridine diphosphokinase [Devosia limi]KKB77369.1 2-amino-4-hydroxy-6-hydroxymethyldihydropteridine pyrophosphokinase [Devosia limi DSM 17137]SHE67892.1 2-amino-4-hydroxy-6-hydroxymethyldihydropteridinediphosphokinase [Devosia limi DSM 17137]
MKSAAWLSLGANIGDPPAQLAEAISRVDAHPHIAVIARSTVITTKAWGKTDQPDFANMAIGVETDLEPLELLEILLGIELEMGRERIEIWGPRVIDIDIIAYDRIAMQSDRLTLPHPHAHNRDFVLDPLTEIAPEVADWVISVASAPR